MSFELPAGTEKTTELDYSAGRIARDVRGHAGYVHVRWSAGPAAGDDLPRVVRGVAKGLGINPDEAHAVAGGVADTFSLDRASHDLITWFRCGGRNVTLVTTDLGELRHGQIAKTFDCHPDAALENAAPTLGVQIALPGFAIAQRAGSTVVLENGPTQIQLARQATAPNTDDMLARAATEFLLGAGLEAPVVKRAGDVLQFTATAGGEPVAGLVRYVRCPGFQVLVLVLSEPAAIAALEPPVRAARCLAAGEAPPTWPDAKP